LLPQPEAAGDAGSAPGVADGVIVMGEMLAPFGVHGWVKVRAHTNDPAALLSHGAWCLRPRQGGQWTERSLETGRVQGGHLVVKLEGVATREAATALKGWEIGVPRQSLPAALPGEIYQADLVGMRVVNQAGLTLGEVAGVVEHGAHPLLRVARQAGAAGRERLIPYVPAIVRAVDVVDGRIDVQWGEDY
jgi:16S rRNA processing protein RimM